MNERFACMYVCVPWLVPGKVTVNFQSELELTGNL